MWHFRKIALLHLEQDADRNENFGVHSGHIMLNLGFLFYSAASLILDYIIFKSMQFIRLLSGSPSGSRYIENNDVPKTEPCGTPQVRQAVERRCYMKNESICCFCHLVIMNNYNLIRQF